MKFHEDRPGDLSGNVDLIVAAARRASVLGADLIAFPEAFDDRVSASRSGGKRKLPRM